MSTLPLPDNHKMDWSALVDTATKAVTGGSGYPEDEGAVKGATQQQQQHYLQQQHQQKQQQQQQLQQSRRTSVMLNQSPSGGLDPSNRTE